MHEPILTEMFTSKSRILVPIFIGLFVCLLSICPKLCRLSKHYLFQMQAAGVQIEHLRYLPIMTYLYLASGVSNGQFRNMSLTNLSSLAVLRATPLPQDASPLITNAPELCPLTQTPYIFSAVTPAGQSLSMTRLRFGEHSCASNFWLWTPPEAGLPRAFFLTDGEVFLGDDDTVSWYYQKYIGDLSKDELRNENAYRKRTAQGTITSQLRRILH